VPAELTVNERVVVPPGAITLDQFSVTVVDVLLGVVGVLLPHPASNATALAAATNHGRRRSSQRRYRADESRMPILESRVMDA
jgi:hypothetical protein